MLPRLKRVPKNLFEASMKSGKSFHSLFFSMRVAPNADNASRFSCVVSKKIDKRAVGRNSLRRKMYSAVGNMISEIKNGHVVIFSAKKGSEALDSEAIRKDMQSMLSRAGLRISP